MKIKIFEPVESQNPLYLQIPEEELFPGLIGFHGGETFAEIKEDGYRAQIHKKGDVVRAFTRNKKEIELRLFPELSKSLKYLPNCVLDCELIGEGEVGYRGFKSVQKRFRHKITEKGIEKYLDSDLLTDSPLALRVFDTLHWEGKDTFGLPLRERRKYTEGILEDKISPSEGLMMSDPFELQNWFMDLTGDFYEGLVCKNPGSIYVPGSRTRDWIKVKRAETFDLAILGAYFYEDKLNQILCGTLNEDNNQFESLAKVNIRRNGFDSEILPLIKDSFSKTPSDNFYFNIKMRALDHAPDFYTDPLNLPLLEVASMNLMRGKNWHSCGMENGDSYSMRIGWVKSIRYDKSAKDATTTGQVAEAYLQAEAKK